MKKIIYSILVIIWMSLIFIFSNQVADDSTKVSDGIIDKTIVAVYKTFNRGATIEEINNIKDIANSPIRKLAHLTIYLILGILIYLLIKEFNLPIKKVILISIIICFLYACSDEIHQLFIEGRSGEIKDIVLDTCGSYIGIILINKFSKKKIN